MPTDEWERGFAAGYRAATRETGERISDFSRSPERHLPKKKRKASAYNKRYAKEYRRLKKKHPRTSFAKLAKMAHKAARRKK